MGYAITRGCQTLALAAAAMAGSLAACRSAAACPVCDGDRAREVRAGIADREHLATTVAGVLLPFVVSFAVVGAVHLGVPGRPAWRRS